MANSFRDDVGFLSKHTDVIVLDACKPALVAVAPGFQGRVMTSSPDGEGSNSLGWINRKFIESGQQNIHFNNYGGEDRFWMGPEAGQFALWFTKGEAFDPAGAKTPPGFNSGAFEVKARTAGAVSLASDFTLVNFSGARFDVALRRDILLLDDLALKEHLGIPVPKGVSKVAFQSVNTIRNAGKAPWQQESGLLSIWILGQFAPLARGLVIVPFIPGDVKEMGPMPNGEYFGKMGPERFKIRGEHVLFRCDGKYRSKLGVSPRRSKNIMASFDPDENLLTVVQFNLPGGAARLPYVNSLWEIQKEPFAGDVVNSYNDGESKPGAGQLGPFYEIETSSCAAELAAGEELTHVHRTFHFTGERSKLNVLARGLLGIDLDTVEFPKA
jgi:hypothetical protein